MYKAAVVGDRDSIYGFAALGLSVFPVSDPVQARETLSQLADGGAFAVVYLTEALASELTDVLEQYRTRTLPAVIPIPGLAGNTGIGIASVKRSVEQAVGSDIIFNENERNG